MRVKVIEPTKGSGVADGVVDGTTLGVTDGLVLGTTLGVTDGVVDSSVLMPMMLIVGQFGCCYRGAAAATPAGRITHCTQRKKWGGVLLQWHPGGLQRGRVAQKACSQQRHQGAAALPYS